MDRLSGLDASFLYLETPEQLLHVCGLIVLDPSTMPNGYSFIDVKSEIARRVRDVPEFTRKLRKVPLGLDHPIWVKDTHFDIDRHVHRLSLPAPGGYAELNELAGHLAGLQLDRSRPLWEMWIIEGYDDGKIVVFTKMHHATVDGVSGSNLISHLCSLEADAEPLSLGPKTRHGRSPHRAELLTRAVVSNATRPVLAAKLLSPSAQLITKTVGRAREGTAMAAPFSAPRTSFNGTITGHRAIAFADMDLEDIRAIKTATGTTVNDVVLAVAGGALRSYLLDRDELPENSLLATVPVSVREESKRSGGANKVSALFAKLGTDTEDPLERLEDMAENNRNAKDHHSAISAETLQDWAEFAAPRTFGLAVRAYAGLRLAEKHPVVHNLVISNVPGPPMPLYFMGAEILALYPLGPVFHGAGLNVTVMSNNGKVHVGLIACRESMPEVDDLVKRFPAELAALKEAVLAQETATPIRKRASTKPPAKKAAAKAAAKKAPAKKTPAKKTPAKA
ncbi:wax ester/triacylglycerol synthase family O-acyltransferase [Nocardioides sp. KIGAM211]|uniref:Diacylglycerol O-acyltransferase n=1 Tax=Nocardioides luti TaxID=2761101 RepID=A0A7X0RD50_9ACTN|nr:wax ester/triacylglycerol synthase family O-acyltransferase [Nocardioides luti]MBB6626094.1 wax ester/triacylglycerol synthase family O-acyltransferase [Nocardioides luti]